MRNILLAASMILSTTHVYASDFTCEAALQDGAATEKSVKLEELRGALVAVVDGFLFSAQVASENQSMLKVTILDQSEGRTATVVHSPLPVSGAPVQVQTFYSGGKAGIYCTAR